MKNRNTDLLLDLSTARERNVGAGLRPAPAIQARVTFFNAWLFILFLIVFSGCTEKYQTFSFKANLELGYALKNAMIKFAEKHPEYKKLINSTIVENDVAIIQNEDKTKNTLYVGEWEVLPEYKLMKIPITTTGYKVIGFNCLFGMKDGEIFVYRMNGDIERFNREQ
jgi:hypothetical protein